MSSDYFFPSPDETALFSIAEQFVLPKRFHIESDPGSVRYDTLEEVIFHIANYPSKSKIVINCTIPDDNHERERRWKLLESQGFDKVIHYGQSATTLSVMLRMLKAKAAVGETVAYFVNFKHFFLTKHATGWRVDALSETGAEKFDPELFTNRFNIKRIELDSRHPDKLNKVVKLLAPQYKHNEFTLGQIGADDETWQLMKSIANGGNFDGYIVDDYDVVGLFAEFKETSFCIHDDLTAYPFEKSVELDIADASELKVNAVRKKETYLIKHFTMKTKKLRRIRLTVKQHTLWHFEASLTVLDRQEVVESELAALNISQNTGTQEEATKSSGDSAKDEPTPKATLNPTAKNSVKATITFTTDNRMLIEAGSKYTGDAEIPCYFHLQQTGNTKNIQIGAEAKKLSKDNPKTVIYDIPGIMVAASKATGEKLSWKFETSRTLDGGLLIHLGNDIKTTPLALFTTVIKNTYDYIKDHSDGDIDSVVIRLPGKTTVSKSDLARASERVGVPLYVS